MARSSPPRPSRSADPVRVAVLRAYAAFAAGGTFRPTAPPALADARQRRLYVNLLRGMIRHRRLLEAEAVRLARRPAHELAPPVLAALVLGLYQMLLLHQPDHAAVFETVEALGGVGQARAKGLVNAVLRAALRERDAGAAAPERTLAERTSHPDWLVTRWTRHFGAAAAAAVCEANNRYESSGVRVAAHRIDRAALIARLARDGIPAAPHPLLPGAFLVTELGALLDNAAFTEGLCYVQDAGSQLLTSWVAPLLGGWILDVCCAPGGKLTHLLELQAAGTGTPAGLRLAGMDASRERLRRVRDNVRRLHLEPPPLLVGDAARLPLLACGAARLAGRPGADGSGWSALLLDVPCSATGMIRKYPELKWRKHEADLARYAAQQSAMLDDAARVLGADGLIVYSTCSLEPEENERQVEAFLARHPDFRRLPFAAVAPPQGLGEPVAGLTTPQGDLQVLPGADRMGLYAALLRRGGGRAGTAGP